MGKKTIPIFMAFAFMLILCSFVTPYPSDKKQGNQIMGKIVYNKKKHSMILSWPAFGSSGNYVVTRGQVNRKDAILLGADNRGEKI